MKVEIAQTPIEGCLEILPAVVADARGAFVKVFQKDAFDALGLCSEWREQYYSVSRNRVLRGLHFQLPPHDHAKLVYCTDGEVLDVAVDLRADSPTFGRHATIRLSASRGNMVYLDRGLAHGFYTASENATLVYNVSSVYAPEHDVGIRWDSAGIPWPDESPIVSERESTHPAFSEFKSPFRLKRSASLR
jgi:dTDP-4-dehydrorhamnose 3,5-epimerase